LLRYEPVPTRNRRSKADLRFRDRHNRRLSMPPEGGITTALTAWMLTARRTFRRCIRKHCAAMRWSSGFRRAGRPHWPARLLGLEARTRASIGNEEHKRAIVSNRPDSNSLPLEACLNCLKSPPDLSICRHRGSVTMLHPIADSLLPAVALRTHPPLYCQSIAPRRQDHALDPHR
jgi:hypothetical protein